MEPKHSRYISASISVHFERPMTERKEQPQNNRQKRIAKVLSWYCCNYNKSLSATRKLIFTHPVGFVCVWTIERIHSVSVSNAQKLLLFWHNIIPEVRWSISIYSLEPNRRVYCLLHEDTEESPLVLVAEKMPKNRFLLFKISETQYQPIETSFWVEAGPDYSANAIATCSIKVGSSMRLWLSKLTQVGSLHNPV